MSATQSSVLRVRGGMRSWLLLLVVLVAASRLLAIPGQPLDLVEVEAATAALDPERVTGRADSPLLSAAVLIARLGHWVIADPVLAMQLVSALASIATAFCLLLLWQRAGLGVISPAAEDQVSRPPAATAAPIAISAAALYAFAPAVCFHGCRISSSTLPMLLIAAGLLAMSSTGRRGVVLGPLLLGAAITLSPVLAPALLVAFVAAVHLRREPWSGIMIGTGLLLALPVAVLGSMVFASAAGPELIWAQLPALGQPAAGELGVVNALGGTTSMQIALLLSVVGWWSLYQRNRRLAWWWLAGFVVTAACLLAAPGRGLAALALPLPALLSGPVAAGIGGLLPGRRSIGVVVAVICCLACGYALPPLFELSRNGSLPLTALSEAQQPEIDTVIVDRRLTPYLELLRAAQRQVHRLLEQDQLAQTTIRRRVARRRWSYVTAAEPGQGWFPAPSSLPGQRLSYKHDATIAALDPTLARAVYTVMEGGLVLDSGTPDAPSSGSGPELAGGEQIMLQPTTPGSWLGAVCEVIDDEVTLGVSTTGRGGRAGKGGRSSLAAGRHHIYLPLRSPSNRRLPQLPAIITAEKSGPGRVVLERLWIDRPSGYRPQRLLPGDQASGLDGLVFGSGFYDVEQFGDPARPGRWTDTRAWLELPGGHGQIIVELCGPRPEPAAVTLTLPRSRWQQSLTIGPSWQEVAIALPTSKARIKLVIEVDNPLVPATEIAGSTDQRQLGVVLGEIRLQLESG